MLKVPSALLAPDLPSARMCLLPVQREARVGQVHSKDSQGQGRPVCMAPVEPMALGILRGSVWAGSSCSGSQYLSLLPTDVAFITTVTFLWKVSAITVVSCLPLYVLKYLKRKLSPPSYSKLSS